MSIFNHFNDLAEEGIPTNFCGFKNDSSVLVQSRTKNLVAGVFVNRFRFPGQHTLVHAGLSFNNNAICGQFFARADHDHVAGNKVTRVDLNFLPISEDPGFGWFQAKQFFNRVASTGFCFGLQVFSQPDQCDNGS